MGPDSQRSTPLSFISQMDGCVVFLGLVVGIYCKSATLTFALIGGHWRVVLS